MMLIALYLPYFAFALFALAGALSKDKSIGWTLAIGAIIMTFCYDVDPELTQVLEVLK